MGDIRSIKWQRILGDENQADPGSEPGNSQIDRAERIYEGPDKDVALVRLKDGRFMYIQHTRQGIIKHVGPRPLLIQSMDFFDRQRLGL